MSETTATKRARPFVSLRVKLIIAFTVLFSVVFAASYYWFYDFTSGRALERVTEDLNVILTGTVAKIDGDAFEDIYENAQPREDGYTDYPGYWEHVQWLSTVHELDPRANLYTFIADPDGAREIIFIGSDGALRDPPFGAQYRQVCTEDPDDCGDLSTNLDAISTGRLINQTEIYSDGFGEWISGYAPIRDSSGEIVGALGVDFQADYVSQVREAILNSVAIAFVLTYAFLFVTVWLISRVFSQPIIRLTRVAQRIGEGEYDHDLSSLRTSIVRDEIDTLTSVFESMVGKIARREEKLKQQVAELQIQIDHSKRDEQVKEIVDNDFFQTLQSKAFEMRARRRDATESD